MTTKKATKKKAAKPKAPRTLGRASSDRSSLEYYMADVTRYKMLTREEEREVGRLALAGDEIAQERLVLANLRFVVAQVRKITVDGVDPMDLITAGNMGLMHAAKKYDPERGVKFVGYANFWVRQFIQKEIDTHGAQMRTSVTQLTLNRRVRRLQETAHRTIGREYTMDELVTLTGRHRDRITEAINYRVVPRSLDEALESDDGSGMTLAQVIGDEDRQTERAQERELRELMSRILDSVLTPRERRIVVDHFGMSGNREQSLQEIGLSLGITRERVRQICRKALGKIVAAKEFHEEMREHFTPNPNHTPGTFLINSRKRSPLPPGMTKEEHRRTLLTSTAGGM